MSPSPLIRWRLLGVTMLHFQRRLLMAQATMFDSWWGPGRCTPQAGSSSWSDGAPPRNSVILRPGVQHCIGVLIFSNLHSLVPRLVVICVALAYLLPLFGNLFLRLNVVRTPPFVTFFSSQFLYLISVLPNCHTFGTFLDGVSLNDGGSSSFFGTLTHDTAYHRYVII